MVPLTAAILSIALAFLIILGLAALVGYERRTRRARLGDTECQHEEVTYSYTTGVGRCLVCGVITEQDI